MKATNIHWKKARLCKKVGNMDTFSPPVSILEIGSGCDPVLVASEAGVLRLSVSPKAILSAVDAWSPLSGLVPSSESFVAAFVVVSPAICS